MGVNQCALVVAAVFVVSVTALSEKPCDTSFGPDCRSISVRFYTPIVVYKNTIFNCTDPNDSISKEEYLENVKQMWIRLLQDTLIGGNNLKMVNLYL